MIRVVLAVAVAAALLIASLPAVEQVRVERTTAATERVAERVERAARALRASEPARGPAAASVPTGRRVVSVVVRRRSLVSAGVSFLAVCPSATESTTAALVTAVEGGSVTRVTLPGRYTLPNDGIVLTRPGTHRLVLEPVQVPDEGADGGADGAHRVRITRLDPSGSAGRGSSSEPAPAGPCDSSIGSAAGATPMPTAPTPQA